MTTLSHPAPRPTETAAADRQPGPNQWIKDHLFGSEEEFDYATPSY